MSAGLSLAFATELARTFLRSTSAEVDPAFMERRSMPPPAAPRSMADSDPALAPLDASTDSTFPAGLECLDSRLEPIRARHKVPALAAAIVRGDTLWAVGVVGVRRAGRPDRALWNDRFHIGSDTKSMTATVVAMLIDERKLDWGTTLEELFPELRASMRPEYRAVTVDMLLHHTSGLPDDRTDPEFFARMRSLRGSSREQRQRGVALALQRPAAYPAGTRNVYANMNFNILGAAIERLTGESWESQVRRLLFDPLRMEHAGFGSPNSPGRIDQPWGHRVSGRWPPRLFWIARTKLPVASAPSGNVSLSMSDWARYAVFHLRGAQGQCALLSCDSFRRLHREEPAGSGYASGWGVTHEDSAVTTLQHAGSDGWWYASIVLVPARGEAILVATNTGGDRAEDACRDAHLAAEAILRSRRDSGDDAP